MAEVQVAARRPQRADARRNFDALLAAAREAFADKGTDASLEDIARRAHVGIGTLYRNFPTRKDLFEAVYVEEVSQLAQVALDVADLPPWDALVSWLRRFVGYIATKRALMQALSTESELVRACRISMHEAGEPLLERAQAAGSVRPEVTFDDLLRMVAGLTSATFVSEEQRARVLAFALDGLRPPR
jgi:AcrR family transcriptional regulator